MNTNNNNWNVIFWQYLYYYCYYSKFSTYTHTHKHLYNSPSCFLFRLAIFLAIDGNIHHAMICTLSIYVHDTKYWMGIFLSFKHYTSTDCSLAEILDRGIICGLLRKIHTKICGPNFRQQSNLCLYFMLETSKKSHPICFYIENSNSTQKPDYFDFELIPLWINLKNLKNGDEFSHRAS